jgi:hypothetical protein
VQLIGGAEQEQRQAAQRALGVVLQLVLLQLGGEGFGGGAQAD